uniref:Pentatricopeptide repeat protein n=1 Tax=Salvia miltiorrhiza TaxID=226208 RepID=A0A678WCD6_SALMI|nr:pentatricopeptide repeat protein [Salvia miltiorrhiza]
MLGLILAIKQSLLVNFRPSLGFGFVSHLHSSCIPLQLHEFSSTASIAPLPIKRSHVVYSHAPQVLDEMSHRAQQESTPSPDAFKIVQRVMEQPSPANAALAHALAVKQGALAHLRTATSLLTVYSRCKELASSSALFAEVVGRDVAFWNAMMSACIDNNCCEAAVGVFKKMVVEGNEFDAISLVALVSAYSSLKAVGKKGQVVHGLSIKAGMLAYTVLSNAVIDMYAKCGALSSSECVFGEVEFKDLVTWNSIISGCFYNSHPERSLWYIKNMASCENRPDSISFSCALAACTILQELDFGLAVHCWATKLGYAVSSHVSVSNSLISFYAQLRDISAAECVFGEMVIKNVVSWNAMIKGLFLNEQAVGAFRLVRDMQLVASIQPDMATVVTVVPYCAELMLLGEGKAVHGFIIRKGMASETSVVNSLINMYSKCSKLKEAWCLFLTMPKKDLVSWNTMIFGYAHNGQYWEARALFKKMLGCCSTFTLPTLLAVLPSCDCPDSVQFGRSIHGWSIKMGFLNQTFAVNSLMHMYISCGALSDVSALFRSTSVKLDGTSWNTVIAGCSHEGHFREALNYFDLMRRRAQAYCSSVTFGSVVSACGNLGLAIEGKVVHGLALKTGASSDTRVQNALVTMYGRLGDSESATLAFNLGDDHNLCSWNCVISAMSQNEDAKKALTLFRSLEFEPNEITISTVLSACAQLGAMSYGKQIHGHVFRSNLHKNPFISAALTDMYSNGGRLDMAERVFLHSPEKSVAAWNSLISAYGFHNFGSRAIETFNDMIRSGGRPTSGSFTSLLSACSHAGLVDEGLAYYECMMSRFKVAPAAEHHVCVVDMLGRSGRIREARDFIEHLPSRGEAAGVWGALLSACSYHGDVEMGREVAEILFSMEPENGSYYVALCNIYVAAGKWEEAVELRSVIHDKHLKKQPGYSFIDIGLR